MSKTSGSHEYCQGYMDKNGIWNNGFYCRRWGGPDITYCCGDGTNRFCCPELPHVVIPTTDNPPVDNTSNTNYIPLITAACVVIIVVFVFVAVVALCCLFCSCCPLRKRQRLRRQSSSFALNGTLPVCTEAEATSSVIAAEALQIPFRDFSLCMSARYGGGGPGSHFSGPHSPSITSQADCKAYGGGVGRAWTPTVSVNTSDDFESAFIGSMYRQNLSADLPWQTTDLQNTCNCYKPNLRLEPKQREVKPLLCSTGNKISFHQSGGCPATLRLEPCSVKMSCMTDEAEIPSCATKTSSCSPTSPFQLVLNRPSPFRTGGVTTTTSSGTSQLRHPLTLVTDAERHKRDSGVLVEEHDTSDICVGMTSDGHVTVVPSSPSRSDYPWNIGN